MDVGCGTEECCDSSESSEAKEASEIGLGILWGFRSEQFSLSELFVMTCPSVLVDAHDLQSSSTSTNSIFPSSDPKMKRKY